nr:hypothetical protein [Actinomadura sp. CNU-125]
MRSALTIAACCAAREGWVMPWTRPAWFTAVPVITPSTGSRSRTASGSRLRATVPQPSPRTNPSAAASKAAQRPRADSAPARAKPMSPAHSSCTVTPPAKARSLSPECSERHARWTATREDAQAASTAIDGPLTSRM